MARRGRGRRTDRHLTSLPSPERSASRPEPAAIPHCLPLALAGQLGAVMLSFVVGIFFYDPATKQLRTSPGATAAMFVPLWVAFGFTVVRVARRRGEHPFGERPYVRRVDGLWFLSGIAAQFVVGFVYFYLPIDSEELARPAREIFDRANENPIGVVLLGIAVGIGAPIMEELFYRGVVHRGFVLACRPGSHYLPMILSAAIFGAIHGQLLQFGGLFGVGLLCAYAFSKTQRIASAIAVHAGFNLTTVVALTVAMFSDKV